VIEFAVDVINQIGLLGAAFLIGIEVIIPPIPSEAVLLLTGFNISLGRFGFIEALIATTLGSLVGATFWFLVGYFFTQNRLTMLIAKYGRWVGLPVENFTKTMVWFEKHGRASVFFGRMVPIVRSLVSIPAGLVKMGWARFYVFSTSGILIWNTLWLTIGVNLGENWKLGEEFASLLDWAVYAVLAVIVIYVLINFFKQLKRNRE
jgi:membrane protein DedA with SNARE-associated domain